MIKVGITDDHKMFRQSLSYLVNSFKNTNTVLTAGNGKELIQSLSHTYIDILLLDLQMPMMDGYETTIYIKKHFPKIKIIILSETESEVIIKKITSIGVHGFVCKSADSNELEKIITEVFNNSYFISYKNLGCKDNYDIEYNEENIFSSREMEIIHLACTEMNSQEIADKLCITSRTVESHCKRIMNKTNSKNFIGVILYSIKHKLIDIDLFKFNNTQL